MLTSACVLALAGLATPAVATASSVTSFSLSGSPFADSFAPLPDYLTLNLVLARRARVTLSIVDQAGQTVRTLVDNVVQTVGLHVWTWDGLDAAGLPAPDGVYVARLVAANWAGIVTQERPLRKGLPAIYPANSAAIVIVVDPGHGGRYPGSGYQGYAEKTFNLAIALHLRDLLEHAGVTVVMTRTTDTAVDQPMSDVNGDGFATSYDDLAARNDIANLARGDINIHVHNNAARCHCVRGTETFTSWLRTWSPEAIDASADIQRAQLATLDQFSDGTYFPIDRGVRKGHFEYMAPYAIACPTAKWHSGCWPPYLPRPTLMPSVLTESLFVNNDIEFALLKRDDVQISLAASFYLGMAEWFNTRDYGTGYQTIGDQPTDSTVNGALTYHVRLTNRGNTPSNGWTLVLGTVPAVQLYDGSGAHGTPVGSIAIPDGLGPGQSVDLDVPVTAPPDAGDWLVKADVRLADDSYLSDAGIVPLQMRLTTTSAP